MNYLFVFISAIIIITIFSSFLEHLKKERDFKNEPDSCLNSFGRSYNFKTNETEIQNGPRK